MKHQRPIGGWIDVRRGSPASNVCAADPHWLVAKGVRDLDSDFRSTGARMHDEAQALVPEGLEAPWPERLWSCRPCADPLFAVLIDVGDRCDRRIGRTQNSERRNKKHPPTIVHPVHHQITSGRDGLRYVRQT